MAVVGGSWVGFDVTPEGAGWRVTVCREGDSLQGGGGVGSWYTERMTSRKIQAILVTLVAMVGLGVAASPSQARSLSDCAGATLACLWNGKNWSGTPAYTNPMNGPFGSCYNVSALNGANNNADSVLNENGFQVSFYDGQNGSGYMFSLAAGAGISDLAAFPSPGNFHNRISSVCRE